jgi:hypothetical protein
MDFNYEMFLKTGNRKKVSLVWHPSFYRRSGFQDEKLFGSGSAIKRSRSATLLLRVRRVADSSIFFFSATGIMSK